MGTFSKNIKRKEFALHFTVSEKLKFVQGHKPFFQITYFSTECFFNRCRNFTECYFSLNIAMEN